MRIKRDKLEQLQTAGKATLVSLPEPKVAAPAPPMETAAKPSGKKQWRFDVERNWDGYIVSVTAKEI